jgi:predicted nucleic acid-binding protein
VIVLDASAAFELLLQTEAGHRISGWLGEFAQVHAPHLLDVEVASALRRAAASGAVPLERSRQALDDLQIMRIERHSHLLCLPRVWELRHNFSAYDACYLALAEMLDGTLLTRDKALAQARLRYGSVELV